MQSRPRTACSRTWARCQMLVPSPSAASWETSAEGAIRVDTATPARAARAALTIERDRSTWWLPGPCHSGRRGDGGHCTTGPILGDAPASDDARRWLERDLPHRGAGLRSPQDGQHPELACENAAVTTPNATRADGPAPVPRVTDTWLVIPLYNEATVVREVISQAREKLCV